VEVVSAIEAAGLKKISTAREISFLRDDFIAGPSEMGSIHVAIPNSI
jgi:hypothetical protein